jgi:hypothetical protein
MIDHNHLDTPTAERSEKAFKSLQAAFALAGHTLARTEAKDGAVTYYATRWGHVRHLPTLDDVKAFVYQIGGHDAQ